MKYFNTILGLFLCVLLVGTTTLAGSKYAVATGTWGATTTWSLTRGGASGAAIPTSTDTVWVPSPYVVTYETSAKTCYNLIIESGAALISPVANPTSSQVYIRVYGDFVQNDGIIGYDPAAPTVMTAICFESYVPGKMVTFKGSGISKISRIRGGNNLSNTGVIIDQDMTLTYIGSSGTGGVGWYGNQGVGNGGSLTINAGRTLTLLDQSYIATASNVDVDGKKNIIQVDGSLLMSGASCTMSLRSDRADSATTLIVNGTVDIGRTLKPTGTTGVLGSIVVNSGGILKVGTAGVGVTYLNNPLQTVTGAGTFQFAGGSMQIGAAAGLDPTNGPIRTTTRTFSSAGGYEFIGNGTAFATGIEFPARVANLTVNDTSATVTLTNSVTIDSSLNFTAGKLITGTNTVTLGSAAIISGANAGSYVDGTVKYVIAAAGAKKWEVGQGTDYLPFAGGFSALTGSDYISVKVNDATATAPTGSTSLLTKMLKRYFRLAKGSSLTAVTADSLVLRYSPTDLAAQTLTWNQMKVFRYDGALWTAVTVKSVDTVANAITVTGAVPSGDFVIAAAASAPPSAVFPEEFSYTAGTLLTDNGWLAHSGTGTNSPKVVAPGLVYNNYASSGIGNAASFTTTGEDDNKTWASYPNGLTSGSIYYSLLVKLDSAHAAGDYFFHLLKNGTTFTSRLFAKKAANNNISFGIAKSSTAANVAYSDSIYTTGTTYLVVAKYSIIPGTTNDTVALWINPAIGGNEPAPTVLESSADRGATDVDTLYGVALRQGTAANAPAGAIDGIRYDTTWRGLLGIAPPSKSIYSVGTANVPGEQGHFASLKAAYDTLSNGFVFNGDCVFYITSDITEPETGGIGIGVACDPTPYTVTFKPYTAVKPTITLAYPADGNSGPSGASFIGLNSAAMAWTDIKKTRNIIIDGSNTAGGTSRDLTFQSTGATRNAIPIVIVGDASAITVKNCNIYYKIATVSTSGNLLVSALLVRSATAANTTTVEKIPSNLIIENNNISSNFAGVAQSAQGFGGYASAAPVVYPSNIVLRNNKIEGKRRGISLYLLGSTDVVGNEVILNQSIGDGLTNEAIYGISTLAASTYNIYKNRITTVASINSSAATTGITAISIEGDGTFNVYNNMISGFALTSANANKSAYVYGIKNSSATATANIFFNTIQMDTLASIGTGAVNYRGIFIANGTNTVKNNIVVNNEDDFASFNIYRPNSGTAGTFAGTLTANYNDYYRAGSTNAKIAFYDTVGVADLAAWKTASAQDANSVSGLAPFVSATDLHMDPNAVPASVASNAGTPIATVTTDFDGDLRDATHPDLGADEYTARALGPVFAATPASLNFNSVSLNQSKKDSLVVKNTGADSLFISGATLTDNSYTVTPTTARLASQASQKFYVTFLPTTVGVKSGALVFTSNDAAGKDTVKVTGSGAGPLVPVTIAEARKDVNSDLIADHSVTKDTMLVYGIITSPNFQATQTSYFMQDATGGINLFSFTLVSAPFAIGDSVYAIGTVQQFHGLTEFVPLTLDAQNLGVLKHNAKVPTAKRLTLHEFATNSETYEGQLIEVDTLYKASGTWPASGVFASVYVTNKSKADTAQLFLDNDTNIDGTPEPAYPINVVGIVSQYSSATTVYNNGYELMPRDTSDIKHTPGIVGVNDLLAGIPSVYELQNNYPNPFNPSTTLRYGLPSNSKVTLKIYNIIGQVVAELVNAEQAAGWHTTAWNASVASGMYFYRIEATSTNDPNNRFVDVKKMLLLK